MVGWKCSILSLIENSPRPLSSDVGNCLQHYFSEYDPANAGDVKTGVKGLNLEEMGLPTFDELIKVYCEAVGRKPIEDWEFIKVWSFFKYGSECIFASFGFMSSV